ncbi:hypothetical protein QBC38DRAFT_229706 [Podospora fimiseda]|uniref:Uncharacterized protein n=1 Tax=Podospora fimiseda TaxID=252190 RepID=A0AAN7BN87_9PEZI|nr:hypothetical protein QBC38DRAFT_229706 [Podospora fimiseda]
MAGHRAKLHPTFALAWATCLGRRHLVLIHYSGETLTSRIQNHRISACVLVSHRKWAVLSSLIGVLDGRKTEHLISFSLCSWKHCTASVWCKLLCFQLMEHTLTQVERFGCRCRVRDHPRV